MKPSSKEWSAERQGSHLSIEGRATFPNDFSTARLRRKPYSLLDGSTLTFTLSFNRDKEPFCGANLIGGVRHLERNVPETVSKVRVVSELGEEFEFAIGGEATK
jgi:hypothetical protein